MALNETTRAMLDTSKLEDIWAYVFERDVGMSGEWRLEARFGDGRLRQRHFTMISVKPGERWSPNGRYIGLGDFSARVAVLERMSRSSWNFATAVPV